MSHLDNLNGQHPKRLLKSTTWLVPAALLVLCVVCLVIRGVGFGRLKL
ncbi:MAG TPA: hypothetical protein VI451_16175 [Anaerolineales bacterium]|nr:hypothetical protein [Anaerolineales bacterium]